MSHLTTLTAHVLSYLVDFKFIINLLSIFIQMDWEHMRIAYCVPLPKNTLIT
jgi:cytochrome c oxidase subunit IV